MSRHVVHIFASKTGGKFQSVQLGHGKVYKLIIQNTVFKFYLFHDTAALSPTSKLHSGIPTLRTIEI